MSSTTRNLIISVLSQWKQCAVEKGARRQGEIGGFKTIHAYKTGNHLTIRRGTSNRHFFELVPRDGTVQVRIIRLEKCLGGPPRKPRSSYYNMLNLWEFAKTAPPSISIRKKSRLHVFFSHENDSKQIMQSNPR